MGAISEQMGGLQKLLDTLSGEIKTIKASHQHQVYRGVVLHARNWREKRSNCWLESKCTAQQSSIRRRAREARLRPRALPPRRSSSAWSSPSSSQRCSSCQVRGGAPRCWAHLSLRPHHVACTFKGRVDGLQRDLTAVRLQQGGNEPSAAALLEKRMAERQSRFEGALMQVRGSLEGQQRAWMFLRCRS